MIIDLNNADEVQVHEISGKAHNLHKLIKLGLPVPKACAIPAAVHIYDDNAKMDRLHSHIKSHEDLKPRAKYAVRSSGAGEDGDRLVLDANNGDLTVLRHDPTA